VLSPRSSSSIRKADRLQVSTFSLTATIIVDKSFLRIQVIAYIPTTDSIIYISATLLLKGTSAEKGKPIRASFFVGTDTIIYVMLTYKRHGHYIAIV